MKGRPPSILLLAAAAVMFAVPGAWADEPATGVARVSVIQGAVSTQRGDSGDWSAAGVNTPVVPGDRVSTGERSRAELQLDFANVLRMEERTVVRIADLSTGRIQVQVAQGLVSFDVFQNSSADVEIDTPNLAIHPARDGVYRIQVNSDGETLVAVRRGEAEVGTAEGSTTLHAGQLVTVRGDSTSAEYKIADAPATDGFDRWNEARDQYIQRAQNSQNVNAYYTGAADLDAYGTWQNVPDYGNVWTPTNVPSDWAPYRDGSWVWEPDWGWTWASYEPWGWAPYHYGRWFLWGGSWAWWPGPVTPFYRPIWAPAYVSFFGFGGGWGFGFGFGSFGWLPIGPCDSFFPWWGHGRGFGFVGFHHFNDFHGVHGAVPPLAPAVRGRAVLSNLNGLETNERLRAGITSVSAEHFGSGRVVRDARPINAEEIRGAQFARGNLPVAPRRGSLSATGQPARAGSVPSRNLESQRFFAHNQPPAVQHSFAAESAQFRQLIEQQRASGAGAEGRAPQRGPAAATPRAGETQRQPVPQSRAQGASGAERGNWSTFEGNRSATADMNRNSAPSRTMGPAASAPQGRPSGNENRGGWQRFSTPPASAGQPGAGGSRGAGSNPQSYHVPQRSQSRPQLDLHHSIVEERASPAGTGRGSYAAAPPSSSYTVPRGQPSYRAPEPPRGYSGGQHYSAPSAPRGNPGSSGGSGGYRGGGGNRGGGSSGGSSHSSGSHHPGRH